jgi:hypothetical protein
VILTAFEHRECADLSRRVQGYLLDWGQLRPGTTAPRREGARAYAGDLMKLATEGMIGSEHGRGYFVTGADGGDADSISE